MISLIRYPGSKAKLVNQIIQRFPINMQAPMFSDSEWEYREPFFGAGSVGLEEMKRIDYRSPIWVNDIDPAMAALWQTVRDHPKELMALCGKFIPTTEAFYKFKAEDGQPLPPVEMAFRKIALHRTSFSGLGAKAGGPIGGKEQSTEYNVDCRWNLAQIRRNIHLAHKVMARFPNLKITNGDFAPLITTATSKTLIYLDPPYYEKGEQLYKYNTSPADHVRLRDALVATPAAWVLSYDDHPVVRELYAGFTIEPIYATYTGATQRGGTRPKNQEVLIFRDAKAATVAA